MLTSSHIMDDRDPNPPLLAIETTTQTTKSPLQMVMENEQFIGAVRDGLLDGLRTSTDHYAGSQLPGNVRALHRYGTTLRQFERGLVPQGFGIVNARGQVQFVAPEDFLSGSQVRFAYFSGTKLDPDDPNYLGDDTLHVNRKGASTRFAIDRQDEPVLQASLFDEPDSPPKIERAMFVIVDYKSETLDGLPQAWIAYPADLNSDGTAITCQEIAPLDLTARNPFDTSVPTPPAVEVTPTLSDAEKPE